MDKKTKIVQASIEVFKEKGIEKTKISDIVKKAEIAQGTFYLYFPSKLSVMPAIAEQIVLQLIKKVEANVALEAPLQEQLSQLVDAIFQVTGEFRDVTVLVYAGFSTTENMSEWETIYTPFYDLLASLLETNKSRHLIRETIDAARTAKLVLGLIETAAEQVYLYDAYDAQKEAEQKAELLTFLEHALRP
ncbi:TetR family transcriptional regulator [Brevibacillus ruminantium]|uniref:TetR family transcriptional regulator n=1 Tax=Brevibacillus ruminantium TaxID=2950604 RepID=A0ABY4WF72_9BACL|nr:TetR family transcriptional regulator [Brevibacillus ruminantium]USG65707.1 TetR family transcriptional regulator [Brevibacillus ruminantium]